MAEERLLDTDIDKDKKYKIRINENGEEELVIEGFDDDGKTEAQSEADEGDVYEVPELDSDDEDAAVLTPEQYAAKLERQRLKEQEDAENFSKYYARAEEFYRGKDYNGALESIAAAEEINAEDGGLCKLKLLVITRNFTDFSREDECADCASAVIQNCSEEQKLELKSHAAPLNSLISDLHRETEALRIENEEKRAERRTVFAAERKKALKFFLAAAIPFVVLLCLFIGFFTVRYAMQNGTYLIISIVFGALAFIAFVAVLITLRKLLAAQHRVSLNEKDTSTQLGRQYVEKSQKLELLKSIRAIFSQE